jgi:hypothetical protein
MQITSTNSPSNNFVIYRKQGLLFDQYNNVYFLYYHTAKEFYNIVTFILIYIYILNVEKIYSIIN